MKLSEKGFEQRSEREFSLYTEHEKGQTVSFRPPVVLAAGPYETFRTVSFSEIGIQPLALHTT